MNNITTNR